MTNHAHQQSDRIAERERTLTPFWKQPLKVSHPAHFMGAQTTPDPLEVPFNVQRIPFFSDSLLLLSTEPPSLTGEHRRYLRAERYSSLSGRFPLSYCTGACISAECAGTGAVDITPLLPLSLPLSLSLSLLGLRGKKGGRGENPDLIFKLWGKIIQQSVCSWN